MDPTGDFDAFLNGKPTLIELFKHVRISTKWYQFGVLLEINSAKLNCIDKDCQETDLKTLKMFELWLSTNASATRKQIIDTLRTERIGENTVAEKYQKALFEIQNLTTQIIHKQSESLSQLILPMEVAHTLYTEGVFSEATFDHVKRSGGSLAEGPLRALQNTISKDTNQLVTFATVLLQSEETVSIGKSILKDYGKIRELYLSPIHRVSFDQIRTKLGELLTTVLPLIEHATTLPKLKMFLRMSYPELKHQLLEAKSFDDVMDIVREKCSPINVVCLEAIIDHCSIEEAKGHITAYQSEVDEFCKEIKLQVCENENFTTDQFSLLKCETIEFVLEWKTDEHTLKEIKELLWKAFGSIAKRVLVKEAKEGNSLIVTCYAPRYLMDVLTKVAEKNFTQLKQMGMIKLTIGYNVIWDASKRCEEARIHEKELLEILEKTRMEAKTKDSEIIMLKSALEEKEDEITTMKQLSVQQQKEIDRSKANTIKEKEVLEKELMSERLRLKVTLTEKEELEKELISTKKTSEERHNEIIILKSTLKEKENLQVQLMTDLEKKQQAILRLQEDLNSEQPELKEQVQRSPVLVAGTLKKDSEDRESDKQAADYPLPEEETLKSKDDKDYRVESGILLLTRAVFLPGTDLPQTFIQSREIQSAQTSDEIEMNIPADWLKRAITNPHITAKAAPIILCIAGLPNSNQSIATQSLLKQLHSTQFPVKEEHGVSFYETSAVRKPASTSLIYSSTCNYALVMESAIKHHLYLQGKFVKNIEVPIIPKSIFDNDDDLDRHFSQMIHDFYRNRASPGNRPDWNQGLPSGIAMINIWDVGTSKTALYILPMLAGHLYSSRVWMFFNLVRDLPRLYDPPEILSERSDKASILKWRARLYHLFRSAQLGSSKDRDRSNVCKLVACHDGSFGNGKIEHMKEQFIKEARVVATHMNVKSLVDMQDVIPFVVEDKEDLLKETFDHIVNMELDKPISLPLSYIFLRSLFYQIEGLLFIKKDVLQSKASKLEIFGDDFENFCQIFTSLGSIIDISLINEESNIVILQPVPYFHELDKLFYLPSEIDPLVTKYGLVTESRATNLYGDAEKAVVIMSSLVHFGIAVEVKPSQISGSLPPLLYHKYVYYVPNASTAPAITKHEPNALCLLRDVNRPMIHSKVAFTKLFLKMYEKAVLYIPEHPHVNVTSIRAHSDSNNDGVIFKMVYLGDAIEFRFSPQQLYEDVVEQVITVCHKMMEITKFKYNFAVMCSNKADQTAVYKLHQHYHHLPNNELCQMCKDDGKFNNALFTYNTVLNKVKNQVPQEKILNGDPLSLYDAYIVAKGMLELSDKTLRVVCQCLDLPEIILFKEKSKWRCCMTILIAWEDLSSENDASKKTLAIKLMKVANEIHKQSEDESKKLEIIARSLDYKVAYSMSTL